MYFLDLIFQFLLLLQKVICLLKLISSYHVWLLEDYKEITLFKRYNSYLTA
jgi:hypothetical protein